MSRLTIRARLVVLSGVLLCMLIATNLYLMRTLAKNSTAVATETELSSIIELANGARIAFGEMRYWLTDLAVSLLTPSERSAAEARGRMNGYLDRLALRKPKLVAEIRSERDEFEKSANDAVDQYTNDKRVIGNSLLAQARQHSVKVDELLTSLINELRGDLTAERDGIVNDVTCSDKQNAHRRCSHFSFGFCADIHHSAFDRCPASSACGCDRRPQRRRFVGTDPLRRV